MRPHMLLDVTLWVVLIIVVIAALAQYQLRSELESEREQLSEYASGLEHQASDLQQRLGSLQGRVQNLTSTLSAAQAELDACYEMIPEPIEAPVVRTNYSSVLVREDATQIAIADLIPGIIAETNSMHPTLTEDTIVLERMPQAASELYAGDIIIYEHEGTRIIHRIMRIGWDSQGWYAITKGDNNPQPDPDPVRFSQVRGLLVGIIY